MNTPAKTKNFNIDTDPKLACTCGHAKCDKRSVLVRALDKAQLMRNDAGRPLSITSGGRCPHHPDEVHRTKPAGHQKCEAIDFACSTDLEKTVLIALAGRYGATHIAPGKSFVHVGWAILPIGDNRVRTWEYS